MSHARRIPYTEAGLKRVKCIRCYRKAEQQWSVQVCANNRRRVWLPLCNECDIQNNAQTLAFFKFPKWWQLIEKYRDKLLSK